MTEKQIAVLMAQPDEPYQQELIRGMMEKAEEFDCRITVFSMYIKYQNNEEREVGDSNIYNLIPYQLFDAVVLFSDLIQTPGVERKLQEKIHREFHGPVICVDMDSEYFYSFWTDGYDSVYAEVSHLIEVHRKKDIAYLTGRKNHVHSARRLQAYQDAMEAHGLSVRKDRIFYGDFWYTSGTGCAEVLLRHRNELPEAVVCANDCMAIGLAEALDKNGVKIPKDILVAGYGTSREGQASPTSLTSTYIPAPYYGGYVLETAMKMLRGEEPEEPHAEGALFVGESCGCHPKMDFLNTRREGWRTKDSEEGHESIHNHLLEDLMLAASFKELLHTAYESIHYLREIRGLDICLDPVWMNAEQLIQQGFRNVGYPEQMVSALSYDSEDSSRCKVGFDHLFPTSTLFPNREEEGRLTYVMPLFFEEKSFGYALLRYTEESAGYESVTRLWLNTLMQGIEAFRRELIIHHLEKQNAVYPVKTYSANTGDDTVDTSGLSDEEIEEMDEVKRILDENLLTYYFQPIVNSIDGEIYSYEALMRSGTEKKISPLSILHYADLLHRLPDVEKATFRNVLDIYANHRKWFGEKKVFINSIPGCELKYSDFVGVEQQLMENADHAVVELTEQAELTDEKLGFMKSQYKKLGVQMAVDDYGTGYSNVSNLLRYMPDYVKIDRSLLSEIQNSLQKQHFVREIIDFCHSNEIMALAEGVETKEELRTVILLGADLIQGYYVARPNPEVLRSVNSQVRMEISRFHQEKEDGSLDETYMAGSTNRISLSRLAREKKSTILIGDKDATFRDITIVGTPGEEAGIHIEVMEGFDGRITLENACLSNIKMRPCILMAENTHMTLCLNGENRMTGGGIRVPEDSGLAVEGDGSLKISLAGSELYAIGNSADRGHGNLEFYQDGELIIEADGQTTIGIGSGMGGNTAIHKGKYTIRMSGDEGVAIGSLRGNQPIEIHDCDMKISTKFYKGAYIGNVEGDAFVKIWRSLVRFNCSGGMVSVIGSLSGSMAEIEMNDLAVYIDISSEHSTGIGSLLGATRIRFGSVGFNYKGAGRQALVYGGDGEDTEIELNSVDVVVDLHSDLGRLTNAPKEKIKMSYGRSVVTINGQEQ